MRKKTVEWKKFSEYGPEIFFSDWEQIFLANVAEADLVISSDKEMPILKLESPFSAVGRMNLESEREKGEETERGKGEETEREKGEETAYSLKKASY